MSVTNSRRAKQLRLTATILGLLGAIFVTLFMQFAAAVGNLGVLATGLIILGSVATAWKRPLIGGVVLIVECLFLIIWTTITPGISHPMYFLPLLASGVLFLLSWREGRRPLYFDAETLRE